MFLDFLRQILFEAAAFGDEKYYKNTFYFVVWILLQNFELFSSDVL